jgi:hypothetical protein
VIEPSALLVADLVEALRRLATVCVGEAVHDPIPHGILQLPHEILRRVSIVALRANASRARLSLEGDIRAPSLMRFERDW